MDNFEKCHSCRGKKKIIGLGTLEKDCPICDGVGWLKLEEDNVVMEDNVIDEVKPDDEKRNEKPSKKRAKGRQIIE